MSKTVIITGALGGVGSACVQAFSADGWDVVGVDTRAQDEVPASADLPFARFVHVNIAEQDAIPQIFEGLTRVNALINNAAVQIAKPLVETLPDEWDLVMNVNVRANYLMVKTAYPLMKGHSSAIVNVGSVHARATSANIAAYATSKGALSVMTRVLAIELAKDDIRVNAILPGAVDTPMLRDGLRRGHLVGTDDDVLLTELGRKHVIGRVGQPHEIAQAILFLADGERSGFMTGAELVVDGGATIRLSTE